MNTNEVTFITAFSDCINDKLVMIAALEVPSDINLRLFSQYLQQSGIAHKITLEGVNQVFWVENTEQAQQIIARYSQYNSGKLVLQDQTGQKANAPSTANRLFANAMRFPLTMLLIVVNGLFFILDLKVSQGDLTGLFSQMTFLPFEISNGQLLFQSLPEMLAEHEYWRLLTPMFIHFGWMHIVFNLLWVWEIGRRIELVNGSSVLLLVTLVSSFSANMLQYMISGPGLFGGMSGVVFGYLGHCLIWDQLVPGKKMGLRSGIYIFMLVFLALGFSGAIDLLGLGSLANGAHLGGLLGGLLTGAVAGVLQRFVKN